MRGRVGVPGGERTSTLAWAVVVALLTWPRVDQLPPSGVDGSWQAGLAMAFDHRLGYGSHIVWNYGPLGFLAITRPYFRLTYALSLTFSAALSFAIAFAALWALRRSFRLVVALPLAWASCACLAPFEPTVVLGVALVWVAGGVATSGTARRQLLVAGAGGATAGVFLLVKFSVGSALLAVVALACLTGSRRMSRLAAAAAGAAGAIAVLWVATGSGLTDLPSWVASSLQLSRGYSVAMALEVPGHRYQYALAGAALLGAGAWVAVSLRRRRLPGAPAIVGCAVVVTYTAFKEAFVRHDPPHVGVFFAVLVLVVFAFPVAAGDWFRVPGAGLALALVVTAAVLLRAASPELPAANPVRNVASAAHAAALVAGVGLGRSVDRARQHLRAVYGLGPHALALLSGHTVWVDPWEEAVAWAYPRLAWDPPPVFESYNAYTSALDRIDASYVAGRGPQMILRQTRRTIDDRDPDFDAPATRVAIMCHYAPILVDGDWEVLSRTTNRCGPATLIRRYSSGGVVTVPPQPGGVVLLRIDGLTPSPLGDVAALLLKAPAPSITVDGRRYRLLPGTAGDLHLLGDDDPVPAPFRAATAHTVGVDGGGWAYRGGASIELFSMSVSPVCC